MVTGGDDEAPECGHEWQLLDVVLEWPGSLSRYGCTRCGAVLPVPAGAVKPGTV